MLETGRQYAHERLEASGEGHAVRQRHVAYYAALVEESGPKLGAEQIATVDHELENLLLAHCSCDVADGGAAMGLMLAASMRRYWVDRGLAQLGHRLTMEALDRPAADERGLPRTRALRAAGWLEYVMGRYGEAQRHLAESAAIAREIGDNGRLSNALMLLGMA